MVDPAIPSEKNEEKNEVKGKVGQVLAVKVGDHDYGGVTITAAYQDGFNGDYHTPDGVKHEGFFGWSEVTGPGSTSSARRPGTSTR